MYTVRYSHGSFQNADTGQAEGVVSTIDIPASEPHITVAEVPIGSQITGLEAGSIETRKRPPSVRGDSTPREPDSNSALNDVEQSDGTNGTESKTPSPPSWAIRHEVEQASTEVSKHQPSAPKFSQATTSGAGEGVREPFPSIERLV